MALLLQGTENCPICRKSENRNFSGKFNILHIWLWFEEFLQMKRIFTWRKIWSLSIKGEKTKFTFVRLKYHFKPFLRISDFGWNSVFVLCISSNQTVFLCAGYNSGRLLLGSNSFRVWTFNARRSTGLMPKGANFAPALSPVGHFGSQVQLGLENQSRHIFFRNYYLFL